jgi:DNA mismatch repair protein MutS2
MSSAMAFRVSERTLERLEWPDLVARLAGEARTPGGRARATGPLFEASAEGCRERLRETSEARAILEAGDAPPLGEIRDLDDALARLAKGGALTARELLDVRGSLVGLQATARFLAGQAAEAPSLARRADPIGDFEDLTREIDFALGPDGNVSDGASPILAGARRDAHRFAAEAQARIERSLRDPAVAGALSDSFFTIRGDRYVLPVRADARHRVPGIVHDASASGTTLYVEPEALVDLNNRHKQAELTIERETRRILRELSERTAERRAEIVVGLGALDEIDLAFARGRLSLSMEGAEPQIGSEGRIELPALRHPLLGGEAVPNDLSLGDGHSVLVISGPNAGGKTVAMKSVALAALMSRAGLHVAAGPGCRIDDFEHVLADIGDAQDLREHLSSFSAHMANLARILEAAGPATLVALDEVGVGTDPGEGAALAQATLEVLAEAGARVVATTHYNLLKEMAEVDARFRNASVEFDPETLAPTYRLRLGAAGSSSALTVAARMGVPQEVLERAGGLLEREDRRLDRMLSELAASRAALERERSEASLLRAESEAARDGYRRKLEQIQARRDKLFQEMRRDLDRSFREAHGEVAEVIRTLQRGGSAREAARAREKLLGLEARSRRAQPEPAAEPEAEPEARIDWNRLAPGDPVTLPGGRVGSVVALPDRRGRATVLVGSARMQLPAGQLRPAGGVPPTPRKPRTATRRDAEPEHRGGNPEVDLRGLRVDEFVDPLEAALDGALARGARRLTVVHGLGTGALRTAVRAHLNAFPSVLRVAEAAASEGGDGVAIAILEED